MFFSKNTANKYKDNSYLLTNIVFGFFPISFILGNFIVNLNIILFCCLGIFYLRSKVIFDKFNFPIKIISLFFFTIIFSTAISSIKVFYFEGYNYSELLRFAKSIFFLRFLLLLAIIYLLNKHNLLNYKYFFIIAGFSALIISLDVIYQYAFGANIIGLKSNGYINSGFFGEELIAGGYIQKFGFFSILLSTLFLENKKYFKFILTIGVICILAFGIIVSGNRMPLILFMFGISLMFFLKLKLKNILLLSFLIILLFLKFFLTSNEYYKSQYLTFYAHFKNIITFSKSKLIDLEFEATDPIHFVYLEEYKKKKLGDEEASKSKINSYNVKWESNHRRIFLSALDTWKLNKILGNGIKSFRITCPKLKGPGLNLGEDLYPGKVNRLCASHPHNYYLEILTDTGIVGLVLILAIAFLFLVFMVRNLKSLNRDNAKNLVLLSAVICLFLEAFPLRSNGSFFTTGNATYIILLGSIILSYKESLITKT